jgi:hypothetical protein
MLINSKLKIYEFNLESVLNHKDKSLIYDYLVATNKILLKSNPRLTNFGIDFHKEYFDCLYDKFSNAYKYMFGNITVINPNKNCYAYVTSRNDTKSNMWHNHSRTSDINGVFYFSVPSKDSGKLLFGDENQNVIFEYQPKENFMLIFPDTLNHCPTHCNSDDYRIAINMELKCIEDVWSETYQRNQF